MVKRSSLWTGAIVAAVALAACTENERSLELTVRTVDENDGCPEQTDSVAEGEGLDPETSADVDGDGSHDRIYLVLDEGAREGCRAFLVIEMRGGTESTVTSEPVWRLGSQGTLPEPQIHSVAEIDGEGGVEVDVDEAVGASTRFAGIFTFDGAALERITPAGEAADLWSGAENALFPYGGSVGHVEGADCADEHDVVVSAALPAGPSENTYAVARRFLDLDGARLVEQDLQRTVATAEELFETFPEFRASPFGSCPS